MPCDCGADKPAVIEPPQKKKVEWRGQLPAQFCVACEGSEVKAVIVRPKDPADKTLRVFAACFTPGCAHIRELDSSAI